MDNDGIELVSTEALVEELQKRCSAMVLGCVFPPKDAGSSIGEDFVMFRSGSATTCFGVVERLKVVLVQQDMATNPLSGFRGSD
jgi:hypothetical protein